MNRRNIWIAALTLAAFSLDGPAAQALTFGQDPQKSVVRGVQRTLKRKLTRSRATGKNVIVTQDDKTLRYQGDLGILQVRGSGNRIYCTNPDRIVFTGDSNTVYYTGSKPQIEDQGEDNRAIQRRGAATGSGTGAATGSGTGSGTGSTNTGSQNKTNTTNTNNSGNNQNNQQNNSTTQVSAANLMLGLVNVNVSNVNVTAYKLVNVENVLNNSQVEVLTQKIENSPGATMKQEVLTNLLRGANILKDNQIVVGVLSSMKRIFFKNTGSTTGGGTGGSTGGGTGGG